jgi:hypothetical protein
MQEKEKSSARLEFSEPVSRLKGVLEYRVLKNGVPVETVREENLIVMVGRAQMAGMLAGEFTGRNINRISFGTVGTTPDLADTDIASPFTKNISGYGFPAAGQVKFNWTLDTGEANGKAILEFGLICADGRLFSRRVRESGKPINKDSDIALEGSWTVIF